MCIELVPWSCAIWNVDWNASRMQVGVLHPVQVGVLIVQEGVLNVCSRETFIVDAKVFSEKP